MSEEVLLFSDIHLACHKRRVERLEDCLKVLDWVFDVAEERGITNILFGGDLFHDRQKIDVYTYQRVFEVLNKRLDGKKKLYLLLGNHDLWYNDKTSVSSVIPLSSLPGVEIISEPKRIFIAGCNWDFIPFTHDPITSLEKLSKYFSEPQYALGHIAIDGAILHGSQYSDVEIEHDGDMVSIGVGLFEHYIHTFLGHYHAEQKVNSKVEYIGSPLELSFGEAFQKKHIIAFNGVSKKKTYISNDFSPKHLVISIKDKDKYDLEGNFVKIKVDDIDEKVINSYLYTKGQPDPDLLIRTSGEMRISNFLLWQLSYAELYFTDKYWPEFNQQEFSKALTSYAQRDRRWGGVKV